MPTIAQRLPSRTLLPTALALLLAAGGTSQQSSFQRDAEPDGPWGRAAIDAYVTAARARTLAACATRGLALPTDFFAWIDADPVRCASVYGCRKDPLPVLLMLRSLEIDLGEQLVRRDYPQLALAFAIQASYRAPSKQASGWNDGDDSVVDAALPDIIPRAPLQLVIPGDPRVRIDTKDATRTLDRDDHVVNFLEDHAPIEVDETTTELPPLEYDEHGVAKPRGKPVQVTKKVLRPLVGADVIASAALQEQFNAYLAAHGHPEVTLDCGDHVVDWHSKAAVEDKALRARIAAAHELFHAAYRKTGRMPAERDRAPSPAESMAWFVRNDRWPFTAEQRAARQWPRFPLSAPWPVLLMLAADDQPLREREDIWLRCAEHGEFRTYGEYIGGIAQQFDMQSARRISPIAFSYGSIQMMWKDGGVCGTMGNIGARTYRICGVPASTAGQPGHCALVYVLEDPMTGAFRCKGGQYATGGDEVTTVHAGWNYDDQGGRRPMVFHQSVAWALDRGLASFVDTLVLRRMWDAADAATRAAEGKAFLQAALDQNQFAMACVEAAIAAAPDAGAALGLFDVFAERFDRTLASNDHFALYPSTVRDLVHARVLALPQPADKAAAEALLADLVRQGCELPALLARTWRAIDGEAGFTKGCIAAAERYLASPQRSKNKRAGERFAAELQEWAKTIEGAADKQAWATAVSVPFAGKETVQIRGKDVADPAVAVLQKLAHEEPAKRRD